MRRFLTAAALTLGVVIAGAGTAAADAGGNAITGSDGIDHGARNGGGTPGNQGGGAAPVCTYRPMDLQPGVPVYDENGTPILANGEGRWYERWCNGTEFAGVVYITPRQPGDLAAEARRYLLLPLPQPSLSPAGDQVVNLATWLWIDPTGWTQRTSTVAVPGESVTVFARPEAVIWSLGDGTVITCDGPGVAFDPTIPAAAQTPTCSHTFTRSSASRPGSAFEASVTVRWRASWTVTGAAGGGDLGVIERTAAFPIRVGEVQAINTPAG
jgi:hypothetical protein